MIPHALRRFGAALALGAALAAPVAEAAAPRWAPTADQRRNAEIMAFYLADDWTTELGRLTIRLADPDTPDRYLGFLYPPGASAPSHLLEGLEPSSDASGLTGVWRKAGDPNADVVRIVLSHYDGDVFSAAFVGYIEGRGELGGRRGYAGDPQPAPQPDPAPPPAPAPQPAPQPAPADFTALRKYEVRVERVTAARDAQRIDVFMTLRNATKAPLYVTSGELQVRLEDTDGAVRENGQVLRPTAAGREHFAATPVLQPGGELKVKFSFHPDAGARPAKVTVIDRDRRAEFGA